MTPQAALLAPAPRQSVQVVSVPLDTGDRAGGYAVLEFGSAAAAQQHYDRRASLLRLPARLLCPRWRMRCLLLQTTQAAVSVCLGGGRERAGAAGIAGATRAGSTAAGPQCDERPAAAALGELRSAGLVCCAGRASNPLPAPLPASLALQAAQPVPADADVCGTAAPGPA
jgi:hypothetical protein